MLGVVAYASFLAVFAWTIAFVEGLAPHSLDGPARMPAGRAALIDLGLLAAFAVQHSVMARRGVARRLSSVVPEAAVRSAYVLASSIVLGFVLWAWQPIDVPVWSVDDPVASVAIDAVGVCGWLLVVIATALINHADLFGLRQVAAHLRRRPYVPPNFVTPGPYLMVRHPLYLGWLVAFWWTPSASVGHVLFAVAMTIYVRIAIVFEERDLVGEHGERYVDYRARVPRLVPLAARRTLQRGEAPSQNRSSPASTTSPTPPSMNSPAARKSRSRSSGTSSRTTSPSGNPPNAK